MLRQPEWKSSSDLTLKMTSAQVVETSVTTNSSFQNYPHSDDHTIRTTNTSGFKPFTINKQYEHPVDFVLKVTALEGTCKYFGVGTHVMTSPGSYTYGTVL